jgi:hypothetical protein
MMGKAKAEHKNGSLEEVRARLNEVRESFQLAKGCSEVQLRNLQRNIDSLTEDCNDLKKNGTVRNVKYLGAFAALSKRVDDLGWKMLIFWLLAFASPHIPFGDILRLLFR